MPRYRIIVTGSGMDIPPEGTQCFATTRFVRAGSSHEASEIAVAQVSDAVAAEPAFSTSPSPQLEVVNIFRVWSPFKLSRPNSGFSFADTPDDLEGALEIEREAGAGWLL